MDLCVCVCVVLKGNILWRVCVKPSLFFFFFCFCMYAWYSVLLLFLSCFLWPSCSLSMLCQQWYLQLMWTGWCNNFTNNCLLFEICFSWSVFRCEHLQNVYGLQGRVHAGWLRALCCLETLQGARCSGFNSCGKWTDHWIGQFVWILLLLLFYYSLSLQSFLVNGCDNIYWFLNCFEILLQVFLPLKQLCSDSLT